MDCVNDDVKIKIFSFLHPEDIYRCYDCFLKNLYNHIGFVVNCTSIISHELVAWFQQKQIKINLLKHEFKSFVSHAWYTNGKLHSNDNQPAIIYLNGTQCWYHYDQRHRDNDLPAVIYDDGSQLWFQNDELHRDNDQPAKIITNKNITNKSLYWYQHGKLHRDNDQPATIESIGNRYWYQHDQLHRDNDQPAIIFHNGDQHWYQHGQLKRDNGKRACIFSFQCL